MERRLLLFVIIVNSIVSNAQIQLGETKISDQHFVKHVNLINKSQEVMNSEARSLFQKSFEETTGSEGALSNYVSLNEPLKSMDLSEVIEEYPAYPERTILLVINTITQKAIPGVLIDPKHILVGGTQYYDFVDSPEMLAFTSLDGFKLLDDLGYANATDIYLFGTDSTDYQNNMALITLSRPLGAIIGWMGFGYNTEASYYSQNTFYVTALEPNEENELTFEKYTAQPDMTLTNSFYFKPYKDFIPGAPFYNTNSSTHGIMSHWGAVSIDGNKTMYDGATRITSEKYSTIASIILNDMPDEADIMPLKLSVEPGIINSSDEFNEFIFYLHNYSESSYTGAVTIDIYLSTDNIIETSDTKLKSYNTGEVTMAPWFSAHYIPADKPKLPEDLVPGLYFLGAIINTEDANIQNNTTPPAECAAVLVFNPKSSNYISGEITVAGGNSGEGYCMLYNHSDDGLGGLADITEVETDLQFEFKNTEDGSYIIGYVPSNSNNNRNVPTYYGDTPQWTNATVINVSASDTIKNININRIELPSLTGTKRISGLLSKSAAKSGNSELDDGFFDDVTVLLTNSGDQTLQGACSPGEDGNYILENLTDGTYNILIDKPGFTLVNNCGVELTNDLTYLENVNFQFNPDSTIEALSLTGSSYLSDLLEISIYPNPVKDILKVKTNIPNEEISKLIIYSADGKIISSKDRIKSDVISFDVKTWQAGMYLVKLITNKNTWAKTFIKE